MRSLRRTPFGAFGGGAVVTLSAFLVLAAGAATGLGVSAAGAAPASRQLHGVSCVSATFCMAVGEQTAAPNGPTKTLTERWSGSKWSVVASPNSATSKFSRFYAVSCSSPKHCMAVGSQFNATTSISRTLVAQWDGTSWSLATNPTPPGDVLSGVACTSTTFCVAVGTRSVAGPVGSTTYAQRWNGQKWTNVVTPNIANGRFAALSGVSCTSTVRCFAVGQYLPPDGRSLPLTERWNGSTWTRVEAANTGELGEGDELRSVSCSSAANCVAAGEYELGGVGRPATFVEQWNGKTWSIVAGADPARSYSGLEGVSCRSATTCLAVGRFVTPRSRFDFGPTKTLAEQWDGKKWSIVPSANPGAQVSDLSAVSCWGTTHCFAVGTLIASSTNRTLTEHWNGASWKTVTSP